MQCGFITRERSNPSVSNVCKRCCKVRSAHAWWKMCMSYGYIFVFVRRAVVLCIVYSDSTDRLYFALISGWACIVSEQELVEALNMVPRSCQGMFQKLGSSETYLQTSRHHTSLWPERCLLLSIPARLCSGVYSCKPLYTVVVNKPCSQEIVMWKEF